MHTEYPGGGEGVLLFFHIHVYKGLACFRRFKILNFNIYLFILLLLFIHFIFWVVGGQEIESSWRMQIWWILFGGSSQKWTIFGVHFYAFTGLFFKLKVKNRDIFCGLPIFYFQGWGGGVVGWGEQ